MEVEPGVCYALNAAITALQAASVIISCRYVSPALSGSCRSSGAQSLDVPGECANDLGREDGPVAEEVVRTVPELFLFEKLCFCGCS